MTRPQIHYLVDISDESAACGRSGCAVTRMHDEVTCEQCKPHRPARDPELGRW